MTRPIDRPDSPHPAPHWKHVTRHEFFSRPWYRLCCPLPRLHPIHLNRWRNR